MSRSRKSVELPFVGNARHARRALFFSVGDCATIAAICLFVGYVVGRMIP